MSAQGLGGTMPWGWIQPMKKAKPMKTNRAMDKAMRRVRNFAVRLDSPRSRTRLNIAAPRLSRTRASSISMMILAMYKRRLTQRLSVPQPEALST